MKVLVCGGRDYASYAKVEKLLDRVKAKYPNLTLIHGGARGADALADRWAFMHKVPKLVFLADWDKHGKAAGAIRNAKMLQQGKPDFVVAFPGGAGTADMIQQAEAKGLAVVKVPS